MIISERAAHPSTDDLRAYGLGKLDNALAEAVANHLESCPACLKVVAKLSGDSFLQNAKGAHGRASAPAPIPAELRDHPEYEDVAELSRGGMGVVYLARHRLMKRLVALKLINRTLLNEPGAKDRFLREIQAAANLDHANIVKAYSAFEAGELLVFAMEYVMGEDLGQIVKRVGPLPVANACAYAYQVARGLQHAHENRLVHRDIKPGNLILTVKGNRHAVKILDFGLAKATYEKGKTGLGLTRTGLTQTGYVLGTPHYIAPEQIEDAARADIRADIYSLGCTLYFLLAGRPPFEANSEIKLFDAHRRDFPVPIHKVRSEVPDQLATVIGKLMVKDPGRRFQTPAEVAAALEPLVRSGGKLKAIAVVPVLPVVVQPSVDPSQLSEPSVSANTPMNKPLAPTVAERPKGRSDPCMPPPLAVTISERPNRSHGGVGATNQRAGKKPTNRWILGFGVTMLLVWVTAIGLWLGGFFGSKTLPQPPVLKGPGGKYAVIIGIDSFSDPQILPRKHAEADAKLLYDVLVDPQYCGVDPLDVRLLLGSPDSKRNSQEANKANVLKALHWVGENAGKDDLVFLVWVGQGAPLGEQTCFFTQDSTFKDRDANALAKKELESIVDTFKTSRFVAFIDINFKGITGMGSDIDPDPDNVLPWSLYKQGRFTERRDRLVFFPNNGLQSSLDLKDHGVFAKVIADGLKGKADVQGYEADGVITATELIYHVRRKLPEEARDHGKGQQPIIWGGEWNRDTDCARDTDYVISQNPAASIHAHKRLDAFNKAAAANNLPNEVTNEGIAYLKRMPRLEANQNLRELYQKLADGKLPAAEFTNERERLLAVMKLPAANADSFAKTVQEAAKIVMKEHDKELSEAQLFDWAIRGLYDSAGDSIPSELLVRLDNIHSVQRPQFNDMLRDAREHLGNRRELDKGKDITLALKAMLQKLSMTSTYIAPEEVAMHEQQLYGDLTGIGVEIRRNFSRNMIQVVTPVFGSPAHRANIFADDIITTIIRERNKDFRLPETISTTGMTVADARKKIIGAKDTRIKLLVEREGVNGPISIDLFRGNVKQESVLGFERNGDASWKYIIDKASAIGYIRLTGFKDSTALELKQLLQSLTGTGLKGLILDLRFNQGGLFNSSVEVSELFLKKGDVIISKRSRNGVETTSVEKEGGRYAGFNMVCLVNGETASGAEIVAACLQDHGRAVIMGSRTYGKGSIDQTVDLADKNGRLQIQTATLWRPSGRNLNKASTHGKDEEEWGVKPNKGFEIPLPRKEYNDLRAHLRARELIYPPGRRLNVFRDRQLERALDHLHSLIPAPLNPDWDPKKNKDRNA